MVETMHSKWVFTKEKCNLRSEPLFHRKLQVPYWKLWDLLTQRACYHQPATDCGIREGKLSTDIVVLVRYPLMTPQSQEIFILANSILDVRSKKLFKDLPPTWWEFAYMITFDYRTVLDQLYHSDCSVTAAPKKQILLIIFTPSKLRKLIQILRKKKLRT